MRGGHRGVRGAAGRAVVAFRRAGAWTTCRRRPGTATPGPSWPRSSRCRSTSTWLAVAGRGARRHDHPAQPLGPARRARTWSSTARGSAPGCWPRTRRWRRCAARSCTSSRSAWSSGGSTRRPTATYVVPRAHDIVVGGTDQEGDWSRTPSPATAAAILARARGWCPSWPARRVLRHRVGPAPRLARRYASSGSADVVHCYGHGGAGVTLELGDRRRGRGPRRPTRWFEEVALATVTKPRGPAPPRAGRPARRPGPAGRRCAGRCRHRPVLPPRARPACRCRSSSSTSGSSTSA